MQMLPGKEHTEMTVGDLVHRRRGDRDTVMHHRAGGRQGRDWRSLPESRSRRNGPNVLGDTE